MCYILPIFVSDFSSKFLTDLAMMVVVVPVTNYSSILNLKQLVSNLSQFCYMTLDVTSHWITAPVKAHNNNFAKYIICCRTLMTIRIIYRIVYIWISKQNFKGLRECILDKEPCKNLKLVSSESISFYKTYLHPLF